MPGYEDIWCHGSCNGIICISYRGRTRSSRSIRLMNPATGDSLTLPKPKMQHSDVILGFHPVTKEYKVVIKCDNLGTDSSWRDTGSALGDSSSTAVLNGVIFTLSKIDPASICIASFNLKDESSKRFPLIDFGEEIDKRSIHIVELQGSVCITFRFADGGNFVVWRLRTDDSGGIDEHGWTLLYSISPWDGMDIEAALFIHQDKILTMSFLDIEGDDSTSYTMVCYRYVKKGNFGENKILYMHQYCYAAHAHVESLVPLPNQ